MKSAGARECPSEEASHGHAENEKRNAEEREAKMAKGDERASRSSLSALLPTSLSLPWFGTSHSNHAAESSSDHAQGRAKRADSEGVKAGCRAAASEAKEKAFTDDCSMKTPGPCEGELVPSTQTSASATTTTTTSTTSTPETSPASNATQLESTLTHNDKKTSSFQSFMEKLNGCKDLKKLLHSRILSECRSKRSHLDSGVLISILEELEGYVREHPSWRGAGRDEIEAASEAVEKLVTVKLYHKLFAVGEQDKVLDHELQTRISCLQFLQPCHLDISQDCIERAGKSLEVARSELQRMNAYKSPKDKLVCLYNCCKVASQLLATSSESATGADELLPLLIYIIVLSNPPALHSNLQFIYHYRHPSRLLGEQGYCLTNIMSAETFLLQVCSNEGQLLHSGALSIDEEEFRSNFQARLHQLQQASCRREGEEEEERDNQRTNEEQGGHERVLEDDGFSSWDDRMFDANATGEERWKEDGEGEGEEEEEEGEEGEGRSRDHVPEALEVSELRLLVAAGRLGTHPAFCYEGKEAHEIPISQVNDLLHQYKNLARLLRSVMAQ